VQRRRRSKAEPKNIFGNSSNVKSKSKTRENINLKSNRRISKPLPPSIPGSTPISINIEDDIKKEIVEKKDIELEESITEEPVIEIIEEKMNADKIIEKQIIPDDKKTLGLSKKRKSKKTIPKPEIKHSSKAKELIDKSNARAFQKPVIKTVKKEGTGKNIVDKNAKKPVKPKRKIRNNVSSFQPANRARRLDRSRHMEYKYEMRRTLEQIGVLDEYRSSILATVWARGERQTSKEANDFLMDKLSEGIIDEEQLSILKKMVDGYTIRR